jgi:hypothetical protein
MITADGGGSNGSRVRLWKVELQKFADETGLILHADSDEFSRLYRFEISHHSEIKSPGSAANLAGNILWH